MAEARIARTVDVTPDALWDCVRAFGDVPWIPGGDRAEIRGEGVGQERILALPNGKVHERLTSLDDRARTLTYAIPEGAPFPATGYEATMAVSDDGGRGRIVWSCTFEPEEGVNAEPIAQSIEKMYAMMVDRIEAHLKRR
jgi:hypothetical protein